MKIVKLTVVALGLLIVLSGCIGDKQQLSNNLPKDLEKYFGIQTDVDVLYVHTNRLAGTAEYAVFNIKKPCPMRIRAGISSDTMSISDPNRWVYPNPVYLELFKGAFVTENPKIITTTEKIINDYSLVGGDEMMEDDRPKEYRDKYYYLQPSINEGEATKLIEKLKKEKTIHASEILSTLGKPAVAEGPTSKEGNITFSFAMDVKKIEKLNNKFPKASEIMKTYEAANVLPKGNYCINTYCMTIDNGGFSGSYGDGRNSVVTFDVDENGKFHVIKQLDSLPEDYGM